MIVIPTHACSADDGREPASDVYGELGADNVATCALRVRWGLQRSQDERVPGCGARISVCHGCGLRTRVNGAPCGACGGEERPEVMIHDDRGARAPDEAMLARIENGNEPVPAHVAGHGVGVQSRQGDAGTRRETKEKAQSKPRAPRKSVKKDAADHGDGMPLFK